LPQIKIKFKMKIKFLFIALLISITSISQNTVKLSGKVEDSFRKRALSFVTVKIKGTSNFTQTNSEGYYELNQAPGDYSIEFSLNGYFSQEKKCTLKNGESSTLDISLKEKSVNMDEIVVKSSSGNRTKETALLKDQLKAAEIKQSIGSQEMSRKGISDVEEGLTKVTGITKVESRGLFVRGLEERYDNLLVNDLQVPSNSPFKKIIPLDLFPTDIVGVLSIYKTFNPNISGDFAGATINVETLDVTKGQTKLNIGFGYTTGNNGEDFLLSQDANTDQGFYGFLNKDRALPKVFGSTPAAKGISPNEYTNSHKQNSWNVDEIKSPLNTSLGFSHTQKFNLNKGSLSYILSINNENKHVVRKGFDRTFNQGQGNYDKNFYQSQYKYQTNSSALADIKYKSDRGSVSLKSFYLRSTESMINDQLGYNNSLANNPNLLIRTNQFEQSSYLNNQLLASYNITQNEDHTIKGGISYVKTSFDQPDRKSIIGNRINDTQIEMTYGGNNLNRQYLSVNGDYYISGLLEYNWKFGENSDGKKNKLSLGYNTFKNNLSSTYRFVGNRITSPLITSTLNDIDAQIVTDVANGKILFKEESNPDYKVKLDHFVNAGYLNLFWNFGSKLEANAGLRLEQSNRVINYRSLGDSFDDPFRSNKENELNFLPSFNSKYIINEKSNVRLAGSRTITRPTTMELLPIQYVNPDGTVELGNYALTQGIAKGDKSLYLKNSENLNLDLKYEFFSSNKNLFAVGVFSKNINKPIERIFIPTASSGGQIITFDNSKSALLYGAEIEVIYQLNNLHESLKNISLGFNTSLMKTNVKVDLKNNALENSEERALQGASNWLINADLKYEFNFSKEIKNTLSLVYNVFGERIYAVGTAGLDHIYEKPFHKLDFVWANKLTKNIDLKFGIDNILNPVYKLELGNNSSVNITENSLIMRDYKRGVGYSLSFGYTF
jgi:hypothetical protein